MINIIAAVAANNVIGNKGKIPWHIPEDFKYFKAMTMGKYVLMGQKTFESILEYLGKPFPGRKSIVVTLDKTYKAPEGVEVFYSLDEAFAAHVSDDVFVCGGGQVYRQTIGRADALYITHVEGDYDGDIYFPVIDQAVWKKTWEEPHVGFAFVKYERA
ncbi:MAG: dihydrofolate reductase [bacterium]|nr:dihydrofolate reductase [bacterium]